MEIVEPTRAPTNLEAFRQAKGRPGSSAQMIKKVQGDLDAVLKFVENPRNVGSFARKFLISRLNKFKATFTALAEGYETVVSRPKEAKVVVTKIPSPAPAQPKRYAEVLKGKREASQGRKAEVLFINKPEGSTKSSAELRKDFQVALRDNRKDLRIRQVKETSKGLVVVAQNKETVHVIKDSPAVRKLEVSINLKEKRRPRVIIYDIERSLSDAEILSLIREQNTELDEAAFSKECKLVFKTGRRDVPQYHGIFKLSTGLFQRFLSEGRVYIDFA